MPSKSEHYIIPANVDLSPEERLRRVESIYVPFTQTLSGLVGKHRDSLALMVTIHSFTPTYLGQKREVELGLLHGHDDRFALAMMKEAPSELQFDTRLNEPYSAKDGVAHTLDTQALPNGLLNVMIEIRNDLIRTPEQQSTMAECLVPWIDRTLAGLREREAV